MPTRFEEKPHNHPATITQMRQRALIKRYDEACASATKDDHGCLIATSRCDSGYAQVKISDGCGTGNARTTEKGGSPFIKTYRLVQYKTGKFAPEGTDFSHLCGRGHLGCINPNHVVAESRKKNLKRQGHTAYVIVESEGRRRKIATMKCDCDPQCLRDGLEEPLEYHEC